MPKMPAMWRSIGLLSFLFISACSSEPDLSGLCTLVGCSYKATIELGSIESSADKMPIHIKSCNAGECHEWTVDRDERWCQSVGAEKFGHDCRVDWKGMLRVGFYIENKPAAIPVEITISSKDDELIAHYQKTIELEVYYPNGYECDKYDPCYGGTFDFANEAD